MNSLRYIDPDNIELAPCNLIEKYYELDLYQIFCTEILEYSADEILVTDETELTDFSESREYYLSKIHQIFKIDISDMNRLYIHEILERIITHKRNNSKFME